MSWVCSFAKVLAVVACGGMLVPQTALATTPVQPVTEFTDIALGPQGTLSGVVVDAQGQPRAQYPVAIWQNGQQVAAATADEQGQFQVRQLRGGVHQVVAGQNAVVYRLWSQDTAPPSAAPQAMLVADGNVVRNNSQTHNPLKRIVTNPWVIAGAVATAIAVPIALNNDKKSGS